MITVKSVLLGSVLTWCLASHSLASTIHVSAYLGDEGVSWDRVLSQEVLGSYVTSENFLGTRFQVLETSITTRIGGHFVGHPLNASQMFFGAVIELADSNDFPDSGDLTSADVLGTALLEFPTTSQQVFGDTSIILQPGWYAVVSGSGLFGTTAIGGAVRSGSDIGDPAHIVWQYDVGWFDRFSAGSNLRLVVEGHVVPEPVTAVLVVVGTLIFVARNSGRKRGT